jgi:hypothetical protein
MVGEWFRKRKTGLLIDRRNVERSLANLIFRFTGTSTLNQSLEGLSSLLTDLITHKNVSLSVGTSTTDVRTAPSAAVGFASDFVTRFPGGAGAGAR